jgi:nucleoside-diphosphate-sugar epimerase
MINRQRRTMSRKILVTGGSGFIGSYILRALAERGDQVICLDVREPGPEAAWLLQPVSGQIEYVQGGVDSLSSVVAAVKMHQPDAIIHAAAITNPLLLSKQPGLALRVMVEGSFNVLETARIFDIGRVVYLSSIGVLPAVQYQPIELLRGSQGQRRSLLLGLSPVVRIGFSDRAPLGGLRFWDAVAALYQAHGGECRMRPAHPL